MDAIHSNVGSLNFVQPQPVPVRQHLDNVGRFVESPAMATSGHLDIADSPL